MQAKKTYIEELREKESSYGKIFKVSGPCTNFIIQWLLPREWLDLKCSNWSRLAMIS